MTFQTINAARRHKVHKMQIHLINLSKRPEVSAAVVDRIAHAVELQLFEDYAPLWQSAGVTVRVSPSLDHLPADAMPLALLDAPDGSGAAAWHSYKSSGLVYGEVFCGSALDNGGTLIEGADSVSVLVSHEALEAVEDPYANWLVQVDDRTLEWRELCDRTQGDCYEKDGVSVSNFLGPRAFRDGPGPYDFRGLLTSPFEVRPAGYCDRWDVVTGDIKTIWGAEVPAYVRQAKTRSHRRATRFKTFDKLHAKRRTSTGKMSAVKLPGSE